MLAVDVPLEWAAGIAAAVSAVVGAVWSALKSERKFRALDAENYRKSLMEDRERWEALARSYLPRREEHK